MPYSLKISTVMPAKMAAGFALDHGYHGIYPLRVLQRFIAVVLCAFYGAE
jgi:hypothetical protein